MAGTQVSDVRCTAAKLAHSLVEVHIKFMVTARRIEVHTSGAGRPRRARMNSPTGRRSLGYMAGVMARTANSHSVT